MKKIKLLGLLIGIVGAGLLITSCSRITDKIFGEDNGGETLSNADTFQLQAMSALKMVSSDETVLPRMMANQLTDEDVTKVKEILPQLDLMLNGSATVDSTITEGEFVINEVTYAYQETITFTDINFEETTYTLTYNVGKTEVEEDLEDEEVETTTIINGVATLDGTTYLEFVSKIEEETERDENELERSFRINLGEGSYALVEESYETEGSEVENEFEYTLVENGVKVLEYSIEIEKDGFKDEIEYEVNEVEYKVTKVSEKEYLIEVEKDDDYEAFARFRKVVAEDGTTSYELIQ